MSAQKVDVLSELRGVVRIAKSASIGVTGNGTRIERAEASIEAVSKLIAAARECFDCELKDMACVGSMAPAEDALGQLFAALARIGGDV